MTSNLELSMVNEQIHKLSQDQSSQSTVDKHASFGELWQNLCTIFSSFCWLPGTLLLSFILPLPRQSSAKPLASDTHCAVCCNCATRAPDRCAPRSLGAIGNPNSSRPRSEGACRKSTSTHTTCSARLPTVRAPAARCTTLFRMTDADLSTRSSDDKVSRSPERSFQIRKICVCQSMGTRLHVEIAKTDSLCCLDSGTERLVCLRIGGAFHSAIEFKVNNLGISSAFLSSLLLACRALPQDRPLLLQPSETPRNLCPGFAGPGVRLLGATPTSSRGSTTQSRYGSFGKRR